MPKTGYHRRDSQVRPGLPDRLSNRLLDIQFHSSRIGHAPILEDEAERSRQHDAKLIVAWKIGHANGPPVTAIRIMRCSGGK